MFLGYREVMVDIDSENEEEMKFRYVILKAANLASKSLINVCFICTLSQF